MGRVLLPKNIQGACNILGPLVDDVEVGISFNETSRGGTDSGFKI
jgi:hypothetical protein